MKESSDAGVTRFYGCDIFLGHQAYDVQLVREDAIRKGRVVLHDALCPLVKLATRRRGECTCWPWFLQ